MDSCKSSAFSVLVDTRLVSLLRIPWLKEVQYESDVT